MKINKLLLTTTALVSIFCVQSAFGGEMRNNMSKRNNMLKHKVHTHKPALHLNIYGWLDAQAGFRIQDSKYYKTTTGTILRTGVTPNNRVLGFDTAGIIRFEPKGKTSKGLLYGANIDVAIDVNPSHKQNNNKFANRGKTFIYLQDKDMGRLALGNNDSAAGTMLPTANNVAVATGGVGGDWGKYVTLQRLSGATTITLHPNDFHLNAGSLLDQGGILPGLAPMQKPRKITYYTPKIQDTGLRLGISYIPDANNVNFAYPNTEVTPSTTPLLGYRDGLSGGISWKGDVNKDNKVEFAVVGEYAEASKEAKSAFHSLGSVGVGLSHMYRDFSTAISYNYLSKSGLRKSTTLKTKKDNYVATLGFAYNIDKKTKVSLTGLISEKWKNRFHNISLGAQYRLAPGLLPYAEVSVFELKQKFQNVSAQTTINGEDLCPSSCTAGSTTVTEDSDKLKNRGASFIIGTRIAF